MDSDLEALCEKYPGLIDRSFNPKTEEVLSILKQNTFSLKEKKDKIEAILGSLSNESISVLTNLSEKITDSSLESEKKPKVDDIDKNGTVKAQLIIEKIRDDCNGLCKKRKIIDEAFEIEIESWKTSPAEEYSKRLKELSQTYKKLLEEQFHCLISVDRYLRCTLDVPVATKLIVHFYERLKTETADARRKRLDAERKKRKYNEERELLSKTEKTQEEFRKSLDILEKERMKAEKKKNGMLAAQNPLFLMDRPHQLSSDVPRGVPANTTLAYPGVHEASAAHATGRPGYQPPPLMGMPTGYPVQYPPVLPPPPSVTPMPPPMPTMPSMPGSIITPRPPHGMGGMPPPPPSGMRYSGMPLPPPPRYSSAGSGNVSAPVSTTSRPPAPPSGHGMNSQPPPPS